MKKGVGSAFDGAEDYVSKDGMENRPKKPNPVDVHVGQRMKLRRAELGFSQEKLGESLGITFQQVQKYEKGTNRIGASRLFDVARALDAPISFFFDGLHKDGAAEIPTGLSESSADYVADFMSSSEGIRLNTSFSKIKDPKVRKRVLDLVRELADEEE